LSFYAKKGANYSDTVLLSRVWRGTANDEGADNMVAASWTGATSSAINHSITISRARYQQTVTIPTNATQVGVQFLMNPIPGAAGVDDWFEIDSVQLEIGPTATPYAANDFTTEWAQCALFYEDMARNPRDGTKWLRVIGMAFANGAGG